MAINLPGILPIYMSLTESITDKERNQLTSKAVMAGFGLAILFLFAGHLIFALLRITVNDLRVGGGLVLLVLSITDLVFGDFRRRLPTQGSSADIGVVPIGIPLIIGPSAITTIIVSQQTFGYIPTLLSLLVNAGVVFLAFYFGPTVMKRLGPNTSKAAAKVASLFLTATAVGMIRKGITGMLEAALKVKL